MQYTIRVGHQYAYANNLNIKYPPPHTKQIWFKDELRLVYRAGSNENTNSMNKITKVKTYNWTK